VHACNKIKAKYQFQWINLQKIYDTSHEWAIFYLKNDLLLIYKKKFVRCWINRKLHFNNHITSCDKESNATLKRKLEFFIDNLKSVVNSLKLLFMNQHHDYIEIIQMMKIRLSFHLRASILRDLVAHVTSFALHKIIEQYKLITIIEESLSSCINVFKLIASSRVIEVESSSRLVKTRFKSEFLIQVFKSSQKIRLK